MILMKPSCILDLKECWASCVIGFGPARLRLYKPPFYSTGVDCFGPFTVKIGRRTEKRWGIVFKCMTTHCVHLDLLESL